MEIASYNFGRHAHANESELEYAIGMLSNQDLFRFAWQEVLPTSTGGFQLVPGGRSGTTNDHPAIFGAPVTFTPKDEAPYAILLKSYYWSAAPPTPGNTLVIQDPTIARPKPCWLILCNLILSTPPDDL